MKVRTYFHQHFLHPSFLQVAEIHTIYDTGPYLLGFPVILLVGSYQMTIDSDLSFRQECIGSVGCSSDSNNCHFPIWEGVIFSYGLEACAH